MRIIHFRDFPSSPNRAVFPSGSFADFAVVVAGGGSNVIKHCSDSIAVTVPASDSWITGTMPIFSWLIYVTEAAHPGLTLKVESSFYDGATTIFSCFPIFANSLTNYMEGLFVPGWKVRFILINATAQDDALVTGMIKQQGCD